MIERTRFNRVRLFSFSYCGRRPEAEEDARLEGGLPRLEGRFILLTPLTLCIPLTPLTPLMLLFGEVEIRELERLPLNSSCILSSSLSHSSKSRRRKKQRTNNIDTSIFLSLLPFFKFNCTFCSKLMASGNCSLAKKTCASFVRNVKKCECMTPAFSSNL